MRLFSEKVKPTFTSSNLNILTIESFEEVFFDVYELEINGSKFIAEKKSDYKGSPVVDIPVVIGSEEYCAPFVLAEGKFEVLFNENNKVFIGSTEVTEKDLSIFEQEEVVEDICLEERDNILEDIIGAREYSLAETELEIKEIKNDVKSNTEINDNVIKGVNKALSRIGNVKKDIASDISTLKETIDTKFVDAEQKVKDYYDSKISLVEATLAGLVSAPPLQEYKHLIEESKSSLLAKISDIKTDTTDVIEEKAPWDKNVIIDPEKVQKDIEKNLNQSFQQQIISLKKSVEMMGGGGSVAKQFAAGGTMDGDLNVVGGILSAGTNLYDIFSTGTGDVGGSGTANYIAQWSDTDTLTDSLLSGGTGLVTVAGDIGINQYIHHNDDPNTYINFTNDRIRFNVGGISYIDLNDAGAQPHDITFNDGGNNVDFTIKGNSNNPLFKTDASAGRIGTNGKGSPEADFHMGGDLKVDSHITTSGNISAQGNLSASGDVYIDGDLFVTEYIKHKNDTNTAIRFTDNKISLDAGGMTFFAVHDDDSAPFTATVNGGSNRINFRAMDKNNDVLLKTDSDAYNVGLYYAGNEKLSTQTDGINVTGGLSAVGTGNNYFRGNVGIGTNHPGEALSIVGAVSASGGLFVGDLPTSDPGVLGQVWNSSGDLKISAG